MAERTIEMLRKLAVLEALPDAVLHLMLERLRTTILGDGELLVESGEESGDIYILADGGLSVVQEEPDGGEVLVSALRAPCVVGEIQAIVGGRRTATLRARGTAVLHCLSEPDLDDLAARSPALLRALGSLVEKRLRTEQTRRAIIGALGAMPPEVVESLLERMEMQTLAPRERLFREGEPGDAWYLVVHGIVRIHSQGQTLAECGPGQSLGELALVTGRPRSASATALSACELSRLHRDDFLEVLKLFPEVLCARIGDIAIEYLTRRPGISPVVPRTRIAVMAATSDVPLVALCRQLEEAAAALAPSGPGLLFVHRGLLCGLTTPPIVRRQQSTPARQR